MSKPTSNSFAFTPAMRLRSRRQFDHVFDGRCSTFTYPLRVYARPNDLEHCRLGLVVTRKVGSAPARNTAKRMLRESFRLLQHDLPPGYDLVIVVARHERLSLTEYQHLLQRAADQLHQQWTKRPTST